MQGAESKELRELILLFSFPRHSNPDTLPSLITRSLEALPSSSVSDPALTLQIIMII